jgi:hypothetical protein
MDYTPAQWMLIRIEFQGSVLYKVFGSWLGSYMDDDHWRLNSGIVGVQESESSYYFKGHSGSVYKCPKNSYGVAGNFNMQQLASFLSHYEATSVNPEDVESVVKEINEAFETRKDTEA